MSQARRIERLEEIVRAQSKKIDDQNKKIEDLEQIIELQRRSGENTVGTSTDHEPTANPDDSHDPAHPDDQFNDLSDI